MRVFVSGMTLGVILMTKKDEFIEKIEQLDPHLKVQKPGYADEDVVDDLEYWKLLIDGQQDD